jgi:hypothetical protein
LGWSAGLASWSIGSGLAVGTRWAGGSLRSGWSIVSVASGLSWATGGSWFSWAARWSGFARWARVAWWLLGLLANSWWAAGEAGGTGNTGATGLSVETGLAVGASGTRQAATFATSLTLLASDVRSARRAADGWGRAVFMHLHHDVMGGHLAELHLVVDLGVNMVHVVVDHWQRYEHGQDRHQREGDCRVGDEAVGLLTSV